jgi:thiosulfate/3-mercaptopyruvate sulfurtransferase
MDISLVRRFHSVACVLAFLLLLSSLGILLARHKTVEAAGETGPVFPGALDLAAWPHGMARTDGSRPENQSTGAEPWTSPQVQQPADLAKELADPKSKKQVIVCVGFGFLYRSAHLPGALFHGPASKPGGLEDLKKWAKDIPRAQPIVIYCGCCPWNRCPNIRPAFKALHEMGFTRLKVLFLETDLATNWVQKGLPVEKGT